MLLLSVKLNDAHTFNTGFTDVFCIIGSPSNRVQNLLVVRRERAVFFFTRVDVNLETVLFTIRIVEAVFHAALARVQHAIHQLLLVKSSETVFL